MSPSSEDIIGPYTIKKLEPSSRILQHFSSPLVQFSIFLSLVLQVAYLAVCCFIGAAIPYSTHVTWRIWALIFAQIAPWLVDLQARFDQFIPLLLRIKLQDNPRYRLIGNVVPRIDVCILTCGESVTLAMHTIAAAAAQDYPADRFEVFILDDGHSAELRDAVDLFNAQQKRCGAKEVRYLSRPKVPSVPTNFKAGNLNFGLAETQRSSGAAFVASLDVDMIPSLDWLRAVSPHLLIDEKVAIATPPQVSCLPTAFDGANVTRRSTTSRTATFSLKVVVSPP